MDPEPYTKRLFEFFREAEQLTKHNMHPCLTSEHLLKVLLDDPKGVSANLIREVGGDPLQVTNSVEAALAGYPKVDGPVVDGKMRVHPSIKAVIPKTLEQSQAAGDNGLCVERMLLGLAGSGGTAAARALADSGVKLDALAEIVDRLCNERKPVYAKRLIEFFRKAEELTKHNMHPCLTSEHLLKVLLDDPKGASANLIQKAGGDPRQVANSVKAALAGYPKVDGPVVDGKMRVHPSIKTVIPKTWKQSQAAGDNELCVERMLLGLAGSGDTAAARALADSGVKLDALAEIVDRLCQERNAYSPSSDSHHKALKRYALDLTAQAQAGELDPVFGRAKEISEVLQVLSQPRKNNPILLGHPGVGKTAIAEGLAQRMIKGDVPESLRHKRLMALDMGALVAGTKFRGDFEKRLKSLLSEIDDEANGMVLFIDEVHTIVGAGRGQGSMDASNLLKPALARGRLRCVGATTFDEYRNHIEKDPALTRRFQPVEIGEPDEKNTLSILRALKKKHEVDYGIRITDKALLAAVALSNRYVSDGFQPDKAIGLIEKAVSNLRMELDSGPEELGSVNNELEQKTIEAKALAEESEPAARDRLKQVEEELAVLQERSSEMTEAWQAEKARRAEIRCVKERLDQARIKLDNAVREGDCARAGQIEHEEIPALRAKLEAHEGSGDGTMMVKEVVTPDQIASVLAHKTGIPIERMLDNDERKRLRGIEDTLTKRVVGQVEAVQAVANVVRRSLLGLSDPGRPRGSLLFLGPSGVGKTELAKALAEFLFDSESKLLRIDMSEYRERHQISRLIGSPPGYRGHEAGGTLTNAVHRRPYQVVLLDEIEKAHDEAFDIFLQVLDDGRLTDGQGKTVDFCNTLVVMTSNLGAKHFLSMREDAGTGSGSAESLDDEGRPHTFDPIIDTHASEGIDPEIAYERIMEEVRAKLRPEFLNRIDKTVMFHRLGREHMEAIAGIQLEHVARRLEERNLTLDVDANVKTWIANCGYDPKYGARSVRRSIQDQIEDRLSDLLVWQEVDDNSVLRLVLRDGEPAFEVQRPEAEPTEVTN